MDISACPYHSQLSKEFKPFDLTDPFPVYKKAREEEPVFYSEELGYYVVSRYADIQEIFRNWQVFTSENAQTPPKPVPDAVRQIMVEGGIVGLSGLSGRIPPDHTRIRRIVTMAFTPKRLRKLEPDIRALAIEMIEKFQDKKHAELVKELVYDLPAFVIFMLLGVPKEEVTQVKAWAISRMMLTFSDTSEEEQLFHARQVVKYWDYCKEMVARRKQQLGDDFPSDLVRLQQEGYEISDREIAAMCYNQLFAGHETTTSLMGNGIRELLKYRHNWEKLCADASLIPGAIEEILRFNPSVITWRRKATEEATIGGFTFPKGADILLLMGSGNRDEAVFENGETLDIERKNAKEHLSFGSGIHYCLGAPLAKLEFKIVLEELTQRIPNLQLTPDQTFEFAYNTSFRAPVALEVEW
ncbi:cytochrome P450 [Runella slithyformis]|uniref:Linalool 8-monooxygenase n=1 Tax=Runella slithyformis (strain ATCC 29530 / DSM 19594 / LMG 11500 / NCIMB 11436 / LSU 4) TaxID=761193 RepID=A0A7U3ZGP0_RUNSL|nr:cytochrome P450 [Runella slithyformis]AEI46894.1 Linalool 8-monooxygenase [Runella slithyformis DSM 19594]